MKKPNEFTAKERVDLMAWSKTVDTDAKAVLEGMEAVRLRVVGHGTPKDVAQVLEGVYAALERLTESVDKKQMEVEP